MSWGWIVVGFEFIRIYLAINIFSKLYIAFLIPFLLEVMLSDNRYAWELQADGTYIQRHPQADESERSAQNIFMDMARPKKS